MLLIEGPTDSTNDLYHADSTRERRSLLQLAHEVLPEFGAVFPRESVVFGANYRHDAIADHCHGREVFPPSGCKGHFVSPYGLDFAEGCDVAYRAARPTRA